MRCVPSIRLGHGSNTRRALTLWYDSLSKKSVVLSGKPVPCKPPVKSVDSSVWEHDLPTMILAVANQTDPKAAVHLTRKGFTLQNAGIGDFPELNYDKTGKFVSAEYGKSAAKLKNSFKTRQEFTVLGDHSKLKEESNAYIWHGEFQWLRVSQASDTPRSSRSKKSVRKRGRDESSEESSDESSEESSDESSKESSGGGSGSPQNAEASNAVVDSEDEMPLLSLQRRLQRRLQRARLEQKLREAAARLQKAQEHYDDIQNQIKILAST